MQELLPWQQPAGAVPQEQLQEQQLGTPLLVLLQRQQQEQEQPQVQEQQQGQPLEQQVQGQQPRQRWPSSLLQGQAGGHGAAATPLGHRCCWLYWPGT